MTSPHALVEKTSITTATTMAASLCLSVALWASPYTPAFASEIFDSPGLIVVTGADEASLNDAIDAAISDGNCSDGCVIDVRATGDLSINNTLNKIAGFDHPIWLVGDTDNTTIINANDHQHLFVDNNDGGFFALQRITLSNGQVKGGEGTKGAGGGLGAGGAMFINNGLVILDRATVKDSNAHRGVSSGTAGKGAKVGNGSVRTGESGASGGRLNSGERHVPADAGAGTAGEGGDCYSGNKTRCGPQDKQHGGNGGFGGGGGSAGGGAGAYQTNSNGDAAGIGGNGGNGGFGAGGGGGGGGGGDTDGGSKGEPASGGSGGSGGTHGAGGAGGTGGCNESCGNGGDGGAGGAGGNGVGFGGGIFVRNTTGGRLIASNASFSNNGADDQGEAIYELNGSGDIIKSNGSINYNNSGFATLSLSVEDLDGNDNNRFLEGERANLVINISGALPDNGGNPVPVYLYLSDLDALAVRGSGDITQDAESDTWSRYPDFAWNGSNLIKLMLPAGQSDKYYVNLPDAGGNNVSNALGAYSGIQLYVDKLLEGDESFTVSLLAGPDYQLSDSDTSQQIIIEDANYQIELRQDDGMSRTAICDAADALEQPAQDPANCQSSDRATSIDVDDLKGLGYVTVQAKRPINFFRDSQDGGLPADWTDDAAKHTTIVTGELFNNALAGGLPVHYGIDAKPDDVLANQVNYNNENYANIDGEVLGQDGAQVFNAVVIPVTDLESQADQPLPPGAARIYFSALPDAVQEAAQNLTLTLAEFPNDPSYDEDNFCNDGNQDYCDVLFNTPAGDYQFYTVSPDSNANQAALTVYDSGEFTAQVVVIDAINGEVVTDDQGSDNPLLIDDQGALSFWVKLGSQPTVDVTVTVNGSDLTFTADDWYLYQNVTLASGDWSGAIAVVVSGGDDQYSAALNRTLTPGDDPSRFKIKEAAIPQVGARQIDIGMQAEVEDYQEGSLAYPVFNVVLSQPLPMAVVADITSTIDGQPTARQVTVPAWRQVAQITIPVADDDLVNGDRTLTATVHAVEDENGATLDNIVVSAMPTATLRVQDDEQARILISQHLPGSASKDDTVRLLPEVEILGVTSSGGLQVQQNDNRLKDIVISPVSGDDPPFDGDVTQQGLLYEWVRDVSIVATDSGEAYDYISLPGQPYKAQINDAAEPLTLSTIPAQHIVRQRGFITVDNSGWYTFSYTPQSDQRFELWMNVADDSSQNKGLILPYFEDQDHDGIPDAQPAPQSAPIELTAGVRYYIEALYEAPETGDGAETAVSVSYSDTAPGDGDASPAPVPLAWLAPATINGGFIVEVYEGIGTESLEAFMQSSAFIAGTPDRMDILTDTLEIPAIDWSTDIGRRITMNLTAPEDGEYQFALASDGDAKLFLLDEDGQRQEIAWVDGVEKYGSYNIDTVQDDFAGHPMTRAQFTLERFGDDIDANKPWDIDYTMADGTPGTLPIGNNHIVSIFGSMEHDDDAHICQEDNLTRSTGPVTYDGTGAPESSNTLTFSNPNGCDAFFDGYDGQSLTLIFQDYPSVYDPEDYTQITVDGHSLDDGPDYPGVREWHWDEAQDTQGQLDSQQRSASLTLAQGKEYTLEIVQINPRDDDHLAVAWRRPTAAAFAVIDTASIAFTRLTLPVTLHADATTGAVTGDDTMDLRFTSEPFTYQGRDYHVTALTLAGDPQTQANGATPHQAPGWLEFTSGFAATVVNDTVLTADTTDTVAITPQDRPTDPEVISLSVGQTQRIGFQLAGEPAQGADIIVDVTIQYPSTDGGNSAEVGLRCVAGTGDQCQQFSFNSENWQTPQYVEVTAIAEGPTANVAYDPTLSKATVSALQHDAPVDNGFDADAITVQIYPDTADNDTVYFAKARGAAISTIGFTDATLDGIQMQDADGNDLNWFWRLDENGKLLGAKTEGGDAGITISAMSDDEANALAGAAITDGADPVTFTANVALNTQYYEDIGDIRSAVTVSGIQWMINTDQPGAVGAVVVNAGQPSITLDSQLTSAAAQTVADLDYFSYQPQGDGRSPVRAAPDEVLVTEFGEITLTAAADDISWHFEPNPRPQPASLTFNLHSAGSGDIEQTIDLSAYNGVPALATGLSALPDYSQPRVVLSGFSAVAEDSGEQTLTVMLKSPDGSQVIPADEDLNVYYTVAQPGVTDPGNMALDLTSKSDDDNNPLSGARALELTQPIVLQSDDGDRFTLEAWVYPNDFNADHGILGGQDAQSADVDLLRLSAGSLIAYGGLSVALPDYLNPAQGFHIAWQMSDSGQALFINGDKVVQNTTPLSGQAPLSLTRVGKGETDYLTGLIDEVRIWGEARSDLQIAQNYYTALVSLTDDDNAGLLGYWALNDYTLDNPEDEQTQPVLRNAAGNAIDTTLQANQQALWPVKQSATLGVDYQGLSSPATQLNNVFGLTPTMTGGQTTFAIGDLNQDRRNDVVLVNRQGELSLMLSQPSAGNARDVRAGHYRRIVTGINLGHAAPLALGDIDGDQDLDLIAGLDTGRLALLHNISHNDAMARATGGAANNAVQFVVRQHLDVEHSALASTTRNATRLFAPAWAPAIGGAPRLLLATENQLLSFDLHADNGQWRLRERPTNRSAFAKVSLNKRLQQRNITPQFVDLDRDGDHDLIIDTFGNLPGQIPGALTYYENYGSDDAPVYFPAPRSHIARVLERAASYLAPEYRRVNIKRHPFDQVAYQQVADMNGDGFDDVMVSDNQGQVHLLTSQGYDFVTIAAGQSSADITVTVLDDAQVETTENIVVQLVEGKPERAYYYYAAGEDRATIQIADNDQAGLVLLDAGGNEVTAAINVSETGAATAYQLQLSSQPTQPVVINLSSSNPNNGGLVALGADLATPPEDGAFTDTVYMQFNANQDDWRTPKVFWIKGIDDRIDDPNAAFVIAAVAGSGDGAYDQQAIAVSASSTDNDDQALVNLAFAGLPNVDAQGAIISGEGQVNALTVSLNAQPTEAVAITLQPTDQEITLFPQRQLVRALKADGDNQHIRSVHSRSLSAAAGSADCPLSGDQTGVFTQTDYGDWCWNESGDYQFQQTRFAERDEQLEQLTFMVDNSYGTLSADTVGARLVAANVADKTPAIEVFDAHTGELIGTAAAAQELLYRTKAAPDAPDPVVSFGVRPATQPSGNDTVTIKVAGDGAAQTLTFTAQDWQQWQRVDDDTLAVGGGVNLSATLTGDNGDADYGDPRALTVVDSAAPRIVLQDWRRALTADGVQLADNADAVVTADDAGSVILNVRLSAAPADNVTVSITEDAAATLTFTPDNYQQWQKLTVDAAGSDAIHVQADNYAAARALTVVQQTLREYQANFFDQAGNLAGDSLTLTFTPDNWRLGQTITVSAVDDQKVEYTSVSTIDLLLADPAQALSGDIGQLRWDFDGALTYTLRPGLDEGFYAEKRFYVTNDDSVYDNHTLDITVRVTETLGEGDPTVSYEILGYLDAPTCVRQDGDCAEQPAAFAFTAAGDSFTAELDLGGQLTGVAQQPLAAAFLARLQDPVAVSIEDNDKPVVRAGVDLNASENTHPGYFTLSVLEPVGIPGGLGVHYRVLGAEDGADFGATAETVPPTGEGLMDPGPDFQAYDLIKQGTLFIPQGKTRVSLPIFPIDDFTPEESLAARYEKVVLVIDPPTGDGGYDSDQYLRDDRNPQYQTAGVRIIDNEQVGLKYVIPMQGLTVDEANVNGFKVGLMSQPQTAVSLDFYNTSVRYENAFDGSFFNISSVTFDNTDWNQWKTIDVQLYNNQMENHDNQSPRFSDLYYTLLDKSDGGDGLNCAANPTDPSQCEPFYNSMKGALNMTTPDAGEDEAKVVEISDAKVSGATSATGDYGALTLTPIKGVSDQFAGDFVYVLNDGDYGSANDRQAMLDAIMQSPSGAIYDVFDYQMTPLQGDPISQQVAVQIKALERIEFGSVSDQANISFPAGKFGQLTFNFDGSHGAYTYTFDTDQIESALTDTDQWRVSDAFVYELQSKGPDDETPQREFIAFNVMLNKYRDADDQIQYQALINGNPPAACDNAPEQTVCSTGGAQYQVSGDVTPNTIGGSPAGVGVQYNVAQAGRPALQPVVTRVNLRDVDGADLWAGNQLIHTNPLFDTNNINGADDLLAPEQVLAGDYGDLTLKADGSFQYAVNTDQLRDGLETTDKRQVNDAFVAQLSDHARVAMTFVSTLQVDQDAEKLTVAMNDELLLPDQAGATFSGALLPADDDNAVVRAGRLPHTVRLRESSLPPQVLAQGLAAALDFIQDRFYDTSMPVFGRMGGGPTTDTTGSSEAAKTPSFIDRMMPLLTAKITAQPHLTTEGLANVVNAVLQSVFGQYNVPLQVLKVDSEKILMRLSYTLGASAATDEFKTDLGMPAMGHFSGSAAGTAKLTLDLVFGINFRSIQSDVNGSKLTRAFFAVTDQDTLSALLGAPQVKPVDIYPLKTWESTSVGQSGVLFVSRNGSQFDKQAPALEPDNIGDINGDLANNYCGVQNICPKLQWKWLEENQSMSWDLNGMKSGSRGGVKDHGTLVGYVTHKDTGDVYGDVIAITLRQPDAIGPNKVTPIQLGVTVDPGNVLASNRASDNLKKEYIRGVLEYFSTVPDANIVYAAEQIRVFDIYSQNYGSNDASTPMHTSQILDLGFTVDVTRQGSSDPIGLHADSYVAKAKVTKAELADRVTPDEIVVLVNDTHADKTQSVVTSCRSASSSSNWKCEIPTNDHLEIKALWKPGGTITKRNFPTDADAFKTKTTYTETVPIAYGKLKLTGKVQGSGSAKTVKWTWEFSSLPAKSLDFPSDSNLIDLPVVEIAAESVASSKVTNDYVISRYALMFAENQPVDESKQPNAISKLTAELAGSIEFRGDIQLFVLGGSINQAQRIPTAVDATATIEPDEVFGRLTGVINAKSTIVNVEADNTAAAPAYVVGQYGVLAIAKDGSYGYYRKPELDKNSWTLNCGDYQTTPADPADASLKAFCKDLLATDDDGKALYWDDEAQAQAEILIKGYAVQGCGAYQAVADGDATCTVNNPNVIYVPEDAKTLTQDGVTSLETAIDPELAGLTGWQDTANLVNRAPLKTVWERIKSGSGGTLYGQTALVDNFFVSVTDDTAFRKLSFTLGKNGGVAANFEGVPFNGLASDTVEYPLDDDLDAGGWTGGALNYHEPGIGEVLQASSLAIQPMAEANIYVNVALRDPRTGAGGDEPSGLVYVTDFKNPKDLVSYAFGGNGALYAKVNAGIDANKDKETDDDPNYQGFSIPGPSVATNLGLVANYRYDGALSDVSSNGGEFMFGAFNVEVDLGEFISDKMVPPLGAMADFLQPVQPIANALTADMKIFQSLNLTHVFDANYDGKVTILEVPTPFLRSGGPKADRYEKQLKQVNRFLEFIAGMAQMIKIAGDLGEELSGAQALDERVISVDGYQIAPEAIRIVPYQTASDFTGVDLSLVPYVNQLGHAVLGIDKHYQYVKTFGGAVNASTVKPMNPVKPPPEKSATKQNTSMGKVKSRYADLQQRGVVSFPILSNPLDVLQFIFGDPADLMLIDVPDFYIEFEVEKGWRPPPVPIFKGKISGDMQIGTDTVVGIDTAGILSAVCGSDAPGPVWDCQGELSAGDRSIRLLNSVFLRDWNEQSYYAGGDTGANKVFWTGAERQLPGITVWDKHELAGNAEIDIGAGLDLGVFGAYFQGGPGIGGGVDLVDLCEPSTPEPCDPIKNGNFTAGGAYDGKIRAYDYVMQIINDPLNSFNIGFTFYVDFESYIETFKIKVWEELIGYFPLYEFDMQGAHWVGGAQSSSGVMLAGATVYFDANDNRQLDPGEPITFTDANGLAGLRIPYHLYDRNRDGRITAQDGTIRHLGGVDVNTGLGVVQ